MGNAKSPSNNMPADQGLDGGYGPADDYEMAHDDGVDSENAEHDGAGEDYEDLTPTPPKQDGKAKARREKQKQKYQKMVDTLQQYAQKAVEWEHVSTVKDQQIQQLVQTLQANKIPVPPEIRLLAAEGRAALSGLKPKQKQELLGDADLESDWEQEDAEEQQMQQQYALQQKLAAIANTAAKKVGVPAKLLVQAAKSLVSMNKLTGNESNLFSHPQTVKLAKYLQQETTQNPKNQKQQQPPQSLRKQGVSAPPKPPDPYAGPNGDVDWLNDFRKGRV